MIDSINYNSLFNFNYKIFNYKTSIDSVIINSKIKELIDVPYDMNNLLYIDNSYGNIVHIPMADELYIECNNYKKNINICNLFIFDNNTNTDNIKIYSTKENDNLIYRDIIIELSISSIIIAQVYKFKVPINNITHGAFIIYPDNLQDVNINNMISYSKKQDISILHDLNQDNYLICVQ